MSERPGRPQSEFQNGDIDFDWREQANCRESKDVDFFPEPSDEEALRKAKAVCAACYVIDECLEFAVVMNQPHGVWGGTAEEERRKIRRKWLADQRREKD